MILKYLQSIIDLYLENTTMPQRVTLRKLQFGLFGVLIAIQTGTGTMTFT